MIQASANPRIIYELRPRLDLRYQGARVVTDERGFRVVSREAHPRGDLASSNAVHLVGLGDSILFGWAIPAEKTLLEGLRERLELAYPATSWRATNTAVPGYSTVMEVETLRDRILPDPVDLVIVVFSANDYEIPAFIREERDIGDFRRSFLVEAVGQILFERRAPHRNPYLVGTGLVDTPRGERKRNGWRLPETDPERLPSRYRDMVGERAYETALDSLRSLSIREEFEVIFVIFWPGDSAIKRWPVEANRARGFHVIDVGSAQQEYLNARGLSISDYVGSDLTRSDVDPHPSAVSHELAAERLFRYLQDSGLAKRLAKSKEGRSQIDAASGRPAIPEPEHAL